LSTNQFKTAGTVPFVLASLRKSCLATDTTTVRAKTLAAARW
jgi:dihydroxyacid dehydratase/phosphogluconate dehydratase